MLKTAIRRSISPLLRVRDRFVNARRVAALQGQHSLRVHFGCGGDRLADYVNIDYRRTPATDVTMDLNVPQLGASTVQEIQACVSDNRQMRIVSLRRRANAARRR